MHVTFASHIFSGILELIWSYILDAENDANPFEERKKAIKDWKKHAIMNIDAQPAILEEAKKLNKIGLRSKDALHI